ncbi:hypothetical protein LshimejAT787_1102670 [Lyophyllum shimeji]|uniref:Uncharacterized protein n=1 Tax=Lyophyllum shimeji TaxID=47721 RepID=A0A9P3URI0_LYOSH|nr:hypothetical protein LshimejAT787_1102670 [Lyophyllum shimeji]
MPLLSNKHKHATNAPAAQPMNGAGSGLNPQPYQSTDLNATNVVPGSGQYHSEGQRVAVGGNHDVLGQPGLGYDQQRYANGGVGTQDNYNMSSTMAGGAGMGASAGAGIDGAVPPSNVVHNSNHHSRSPGSGQAFAGKVERTVGKVIGSDSLKAKGLQKEQEANAYKVQGAELSVAERLEREALMRRERAVAHGAHPDNKHLGAGHQGGADGMPGGY